MGEQICKIVVGGLVLGKDEKFVLVEEENGQLNFPCGGLEKEAIEAGAKREITEETGLRVALDFVIGVYHNPNRNEKNVIKIIYAAHPVGGKLSDHQGARFYTRQEFNKIPRRKLRDNAVWMAVDDYFKNREHSNSVIREYK
ncbi:MAG: NUDIX domain-containing protein [Candidatus Woesearchaeota archaeon]